MRLSHAALVGIASTLALCGSTALWAQETPAAVKDPISPADCLRDKKKAPDCLRLGLLSAQGKEIPQDVPRALELLDAACRAEVPRACYQYGWLLLQHPARAENVARGAEFLEKACKQKDVEACTALGGAYVSGIGVPRDAQRSVKWLDSGCEANQSLACATLASLLDTGDGIARDPKRANKLMAKACELGDTAMCERGCKSGDTAMCERACKSGDGQSCVAWGAQLCCAGPGAAAGVDNADAAYALACDAGAAEGCARLAARAKDGARAVALRQRACTLGHVWSCAEVAQAYYLGGDVPVDLAASVDLYTKACEKEVHAACIVLGGIYARGERGAEQTPKGKPYLAKACGEDVACKTIVANGGIPKAWGGSLEDLRPDRNMSMGVSQYDQPPRLLRQTKPNYPRRAYVRKIVGVVYLRILIDAEGRVSDVGVVSGVPELNAAAVECVRQWEFAPARRNGVAVSTMADAPITFQLLK